MDISKVCRSCLTNVGEMVSLYEAYSTDMCIGEVLMSITTLSALEFYDDNENLPKQICSICIKNLKHAYTFVSLCRDSEEKLQNCLVEAATITETNVSNENFFIILDNTNISDCLIPEEAIETNALYLIQTDNEYNTQESEYCSASNDSTPVENVTILPVETEKSNYPTDISNNNKKTNSLSDALQLEKDEHHSFLNVFIKSVDENERIAKKKRTQRLKLNTVKSKENENKIDNSASDPSKRPYLCTVCGSSFTSNSYLTCHMRGHTGEKPYSCTECSSSFTNSSYLIRHMRIHTGEKPFPCTECTSTFAEKQSLIVHMRSHTGERPYSCTICSKPFSRASHVIRHMRLHTGEKPYSCTECDSSFVEKATLIAHARIHSGEKPYSCKVCNRSFNVKKTLTRHMLRHNGEKPYSCTLCNCSFIQKSSLSLHMQKKHASA